jgi:hypothetical protein
MRGLENSPSSQLTCSGDAEAIRHLKQAIASGKHWYTALLGAIGLWRSSNEVLNGRTYHYLIDGEAFDWLLLAERLCEEVDGLLPAEEKDALLFRGIPPIDLSPGEIKELIGTSKYNQYLNYFYGITVQEALILAVQDEVHKEKHALVLRSEHDTANEAYRRIFGATKAALLKRFRREKGYPHPRSITLSELKEFTYWLFKYRLKQCDKAKVASDTKKALAYLKQQWAKRGVSGVLVTDKMLFERQP